jgi:aryl-alcohol dehydrogenase
MSITTQAAVVDSPGAPFTVCDVELDDLRADEVLVRMTAAGLCHTDLGVASGGLPFPLPGVLGHEGAGVVQAVGADVTSVDPGDHVVLSFTSCGRCANCRSGHPAYCSTWLPANLIGGARTDGTATITRAGEPLGSHFFGQSSFARAAIVQTGVGAVWNVLAPRPGSTVVVTGAGAVGLSAVMAAALTPALRIVAVDIVPRRLDVARKLGATHVIDASTEDFPARIAEITGGAGCDGVIETTGNVTVLRQAVDALAARGTVVIVGAPPFGTEVSVDVNGMLGGKKVVGVTLGDSETQALIPTLAAMVADGRLPVSELVTTYDFSDIQRAVADVTSGVAIKPVLRFTD